MEAHNGKTRLGSSEVPLVVKFADAKRREQPLAGLGLKRGSYLGDLKHMPDPAEFAMYQVAPYSAQFPWEYHGRRPNRGCICLCMMDRNVEHCDRTVPHVLPLYL